MAIPFLEVGLKLLEKLIPDPQAKAQAQLELLKLEQAGEFKELDLDMQGRLAQADINKAEANSGDAFRAGWRPLVGYICALGLGYQLLARPLLEWLSMSLGWAIPPPLETDTLLTLLFGMLGLGAYRTVEKVKGNV